MPQLVPVAVLWRRLRRDTAKAETSLQGEKPQLRLSENAVVGVSLNTPIVLTCSGKTSECARVCYATRTPMSLLQGALRFQVSNFRRCRELERAPGAEIDAEADRLAAAVRARGLDVLRINGSGDLTAGLVRVLNSLLRRHRWLSLWVVTRVPELARKLDRRKNLHLMLSADRATSPDRWRELLRLTRQHRRAYLSWLRTDAGPIPDEVSIIFNQHVGACRKDLPVEGRTCPKTVRLERGGAAHHLACLRCRRCFTDALR